MSTTSRGPSRRTLVKGAAWSVPVVAIGKPVMAQDAACSPNSCPPECLDFGLTGTACRYSRTNYYFFGFCITNNCPPGTVTPGTTYTLTITNQTGVPFTDLAGNPATVTLVVPEAGAGPLCSEPQWYSAPNNAAFIDLLLDGESIFNGPSDMIPAPQRTEGCEAGPPGMDAATLTEDSTSEAVEPSAEPEAVEPSAEPEADSARVTTSTETTTVEPTTDEASSTAQPDNG